MKKMPILLFAVVAGVVAARSAISCSCLGPVPSPIRDYEQSSAVFVGTLISSYDAKAGASKQSSADRILYTFEVSQIWKGTIADTLTVVSARSSPSCGVKFVVGENYVVYARDWKRSLGVDSCSRTGLLTLREDDLIALPNPIWIRYENLPVYR